MSFEYADGLRYLFLDFNAYFAAVEQHDDPALLGRPVIVAPSASEHTSAIAVSYEAREYGIRRGTRIREAREMCPGIAVRTARHDRYVRLHKQLMTLIERHLPVSKVYSIDEAAFRLSPPEFTAPAAMDLASMQLPNVRWAQSAMAAIRGSDAAVILTEWDDFRRLDLKELAGSLRRPLLIDLRNLFSPAEAAEAGLDYVSIGRPATRARVPVE